jgi:broad specificity phosphatase PhoE
VPVTELIAVRHGESEGNVAREAAMAERAEVITTSARDPDVPLSPRGRDQAQAVGRWLVEQRPHLGAVWSSPYVRARQTAELAMSAIEPAPRIRMDERLRDRELGILDRLTGHGVATRYPDEAARRRYLGKLYYRPPGGESWADVALRLRSFLADLDRGDTDDAALLFCHDAVIVLLRYVLEGLNEQQLIDLGRAEVVANGSITRLVRHGDTWRAAVFNAQDHLFASGTEPTTHEGQRDVHPD